MNDPHTNMQYEKMNNMSVVKQNNTTYGYASICIVNQLTNIFFVYN